MEHTNGTNLIGYERSRQIAVEGYSADHDRHHAEAMLFAAMSYVESAILSQRNPGMQVIKPAVWPWMAEYWKPTGDVVKDAIKAGALIAAAIDAIIDEDKQ